MSVPTLKKGNLIYPVGRIFLLAPWRPSEPGSFWVWSWIMPFTVATSSTIKCEQSSLWVLFWLLLVSMLHFQKELDPQDTTKLACRVDVNQANYNYDLGLNNHNMDIIQHILQNRSVIFRWCEKSCDSKWTKYIHTHADSLCDWQFI